MSSLYTSKQSRPALRPACPEYDAYICGIAGAMEQIEYEWQNCVTVYNDARKRRGEGVEKLHGGGVNEHDMSNENGRCTKVFAEQRSVTRKRKECHRKPGRYGGARSPKFFLAQTRPDGTWVFIAAY